ncbi:phage tail tape measure protein [Acetobacteraceae bacterium]|nr:phage tail tape measure protein [Acetobacteraceae bacterium]
MQKMENEIGLLKKKQAIETQKIKADLERQRAMMESDPYAGANTETDPFSVSNRAGGPSFLKNHPHKILAGDQTDSLGLEIAELAKPQAPSTAFAEVSATPNAHPDLYGPLRRGQLQIGGIRLTLGGFLAEEGIWRSKDTGSANVTAFSAIPWGNSPYADTSSYQQTARASRIAVLAEGMVAKNIEVDGYLEMDFGGAGSSANSRQSNSYSPRVRNVYAEFKDMANGWYVLAGQNWSLATMSAKGMWARDEQIPLAIDLNLVPGFTWTRNAQLRIVKMFAKNKFGVGISAESPSAVVPGSYCQNGESSNGSCTSQTPWGSATVSHTGTGTNNPDTYYATDIAPDVIAKITADPGWGHFEFDGMMRFFHDRTSQYDASTQAGQGQNHTAIGGGVGGAFLLPLIPRRLFFQANGMWGYGIGRYGSTQLPDYTFNRQGGPNPLEEANLMIGMYGNVTPKLRLYGYAGMDSVLHNSSFNSGGNYYGYGNPNYNMSGCSTPGAPASTCQASSNIHMLGEVTGGFWYTAMSGDYGSVLVGAQYAFDYVSAFSGMSLSGGSTTPHTTENMVFFTVRYQPFS